MIGDRGPYAVGSHQQSVGVASPSQAWDRDQYKDTREDWPSEALEAFHHGGGSEEPGQATASTLNRDEAQALALYA